MTSGDYVWDPFWCPLLNVLYTQAGFEHHSFCFYKNLRRCLEKTDNLGMKESYRIIIFLLYLKWVLIVFTLMMAMWRVVKNADVGNKINFWHLLPSLCLHVLICQVHLPYMVVINKVIYKGHRKVTSPWMWVAAFMIFMSMISFHPHDSSKL